MSKELEALHKIFVPIECNEVRLDGDLDVSVEREIYLTIRKALTPPTVEEVREELSNFLDKQVFFDDKRCHFYYITTKQYYGEYYGGCEKIICSYSEDGYLSFERELPPRLAKMVCSYYESLVEKERIKNE